MHQASRPRQPAEWEIHSAVWTAWPSHRDLWQDSLPLAQEEFTALCKAIADLDPKSRLPRGEKLEILVPNDQADREARKALAGLGADFHRIPFGDIWLRDTGPVFLEETAQGILETARFRFNGWGAKYILPYDDQVAREIVEKAKIANDRSFDFVLEGGSVEVDGAGTCLTTRQCLLNKNRNPGFDEQQIQKRLFEALGLKKILWLENGLLNDHTDGHIDNLARFVEPGHVLCMKAESEDDPNRDVLDEIANRLKSFADVEGRSLKITRIASPGLVTDEEGEAMPASYMNFYIGNTTVVVPTFGSRYDDAALKAFETLFPGRRIVGTSSRHILEGGGSFHCITQQQPLSRKELR